MLKAYFVTGNTFEETGTAVIAETSAEAKKFAYGSDGCDGAEWIDLRPRVLKNVNIIGLSKGIVEPAIDALRLGMYGWITGECPNCGKFSEQVFYDKGFYCTECERLTDEAGGKGE